MSNKPFLSNLAKRTEKLEENVTTLTEEIDALLGGGESGERVIKTAPGSYDSSLNLTGHTNGMGIHTEPLPVSDIERMVLAQDVPSGSTMYTVYYDGNQTPVKRVTSGSNAGWDFLTTTEYPYAGVAWYWKDNVLTEETFLSMLDIVFVAGAGGSALVDDTLTKSGKAADAKVTGDRLAELSEELSALKGDNEPAERKIETAPGSYDSSFNLVGYTNNQGIHTEPLLVSEIEHVCLTEDVPSGSTMYTVYFDADKTPVKRVTSSRYADYDFLTTTEYPYVSVSWYWSGGYLTEDEFLSMLDFRFKDGSGDASQGVKAYKYAFPKWADIHPWIKFDGVTDDEVNIRENTFSVWYNRFHALTETYAGIGLQEINMSVDYLAANADDAVPEAITNLPNGGLYMWHLPAPADDAGNYKAVHYKPKILLLSGVHGDETSSVWCMWKLLDALCKNDAEYRAITLLRNFCDIYIAPMVNPYGIEHRTRQNENSININRDFNVHNWTANASEADYPSEPNSQYSTRCLSWWMKKISPDTMVDYHNSYGSDESETGKFVQWGTSPFKAVQSLIEENVMDVTPYIRKNLAPKFDSYHHRFGHATEYTLARYRLGWSSLYAAEVGSLAATYEVVRLVHWNGESILAAENEPEICAMNFHGVVNFLIKLVQYTVELLNSGIDWKKSIDWIDDAN